MAEHSMCQPGRPGWHIECSAMSAIHLGQPFDIHGGGQDLIFPHHENEIAQSEGPKGLPFARYFVHGGLLTLNREKMSKSLGNFFSLKEVFDRMEPKAVRYYLLSDHYRGPQDFSDGALEEARQALARIEEALESIAFVAGRGGQEAVPAHAGPVSAKVLECLADDFHTPKAIACLQDWAGKAFLDFKSKKWAPAAARNAVADVVWAASKLLGLPISAQVPVPSEEAVSLLARREESRSQKDFAQADRLRRELAQRYGLAVEDTPYGPRLKKKARE